MTRQSGAHPCARAMVRWLRAAARRRSSASGGLWWPATSAGSSRSWRGKEVSERAPGQRGEREGGELSMEGKTDGDGGPRSGGERWRHSHWRGQEAEREGRGARGVLRRENGGGENGALRRRATPFLNGTAGSRGRGEGVWGRRPRGGRRRRERGDAVVDSSGGRQRPLAGGRGRHSCRANKGAQG
jgi:hypothetical protein